jgi:hypothetical protein
LQTPLLLNGSESGGGHFPPGSSSLRDPAIQQNQRSRDIKEERYESIDSTKKKDASISDRTELVCACTGGSSITATTATRWRLSRLKELNTIGGSNTATGAKALFLNDAGSVNTANGAEALYRNTTAFLNTTMGYQALPHQDLTLRRHLVGKEIRIWLVLVRWIPAKSVQTPPLVTPNF